MSFGELSSEQRLDIPAPSHHVGNVHVFLFEAIENDLLTDREAAHARAQIVVAMTTDLWSQGEEVEALGQGWMKRSVISGLPLSLAM
jgi:hypothetical protein